MTLIWAFVLLCTQRAETLCYLQRRVSCHVTIWWLVNDKKMLSALLSRGAEESGPQNRQVGCGVVVM